MHPVRVLLDKEMRQIRRSRAALASSTLLPLLLITVAPMAQLLAMRNVPSAPAEIPGGVAPPGLTDALHDPTLFFVRFMLPMFICLGGLIVPSVAATYTVVAERERRSLDLLMALPVTVTDILVAKMLSMLILAGLVVVPLFIIDAAILLWLQAATPVDVALLLVLLVSAIACALGEALLLALLARDFRTANNLNGAILGPLILIVIGILLAIPYPAHYAVLIAFMLASGGLAIFASLRWLTFERYLA